MSSDQQSIPSGSRSTGPASWRQGRQAGAQRRPEYRWQQSAGPAERRPLLTRRRFRNAAWLVLAAGLLAALIGALLFAPRRSPLVVIAAVYEESLPPGSRVLEDVTMLRELDRSTLRVYGEAEDWTSRERGLRVLDQHLQRISRDLRPDEPVLLYVNMHGAVDGAGNPCLIPPGAAAARSETWLPVRTLFERLKDPALLPAHVHKLVILDATRLRVHWRTGILDNTFAARLPQAVQEAAVPNLAVLCAASPGETSWVAPELSGSVFGHFLGLGLAGEADGALSTFKPDRRVSLYELHAYLETSVNSWARQHRGQTQRPMLLPAGVPDFALNLALKPNELRAFREDVARAARGVDTQRYTQIDELWLRRDDLLADAPYQADPAGWHRFQHRLLWLEQAAAAGGAYAGSVHSLLNQLKRYAAGDAAAAPVPRVPLRAVSDAALARSLGALDDVSAASLQERWTQFAEQPGAARLQAAVDGWSADGPVAHFAQRHYLRMLQRYEDADWWRQPEVIRRSLQLRQQAAELSAPDQRAAFYWLRAQIQAGDAARQTGEDCLLAGDAATVEVRDAAWTAAEGHYQSAARIADLVSQAFRTRDRAYAQLPDLAQWFFRPAATESEEVRLDNRKRVNALIAQAHQLSAALDRHSTTEGKAALGQPGFWGSAQQVESELDLLCEAVLARGRALSDREPTSGEARVAALRDIESLLQIALLPAPLRSRLRERLTTWSRLPPEPDAIPVDSADSIGVAWMGRAAEHPVLRILQMDEVMVETTGPADPAVRSAPERDSLAAIELQGERVRQRLAALADQNQANLAEWLEVEARGDAAEGTEHLPARTALSQAAGAIRAAAPVGLLPLDLDPLAALAAFDLEQLLIWHARRALDDFWGSAGADEPALFETAAAGYLQAAEQVLRSHPTRQRQLDRLQALLASRRLAAAGGIGLAATDLLLIKDDEPGTGSVEVRRIEGAAGQALPAGRLGIWFRDNQGRIAASARTLDTAHLAAAPEQLAYAMPGESLAARGPQLQAVAMLRGHEFTRPSLLRLLGGTTVDFQPQEPAETTVTLYGARRKEASILFILDCSNSMNAPQTVEAPVEGLPLATTTRMEVAKFALQSMLDRLAREEGKRVGVRFYGHRVGWNIDRPTEMLPQTDYARPIPGDLRPFEDVELVLPLGRFDTVAAGQVRRLLDSVRPWGETPLYLALAQAVRDFALDKPGTERSIVVVTDGINYQFNPTPEAAKTRMDVLQERGTAPIRIHIVGFGIPETEQEEAVREFSALAVETDGSFHQATGVGELLTHLESLLGYGEYALLDPQRREIGAARVDVPIPVPDPLQSGSYEVSWEQLREPLLLAGGEAVELEIGATGRSLLSLPYEAGAPAFRPLVRSTPADRTGMNVGIHQPVRREGQVSLPFSFQRADRRFTPRPAEVWIEVTPRSADRLQVFPAYVFYDADFVRQKRAPLLDWNAADWPSAAERAEIRVFGKATKTRPTATVSLADVADRPPPDGEGHMLADVSGWTYQVRTRRDADGFPYRVRLLERHGAASAGVGSIKVELVPMPGRIIRQFDAENGLVLHTFYYGGPDRAVPESVEIHFTTRQALESGAWQIDQPYSVPVAASRDVLEVFVPPLAPPR